MMFAFPSCRRSHLCYVIAPSPAFLRRALRLLFMGDRPENSWGDVLLRHSAAEADGRVTFLLPLVVLQSRE